MALAAQDGFRGIPFNKKNIGASFLKTVDSLGGITYQLMA